MSRLPLRLARGRGRQEFQRLHLQQGARQITTSEWLLAEADNSSNNNGNGNDSGSGSGGGRVSGGRPGGFSNGPPRPPYGNSGQYPNPSRGGFSNANDMGNRDGGHPGSPNNAYERGPPPSFPPQTSGFQRSQTAANEFGSMLNRSSTGQAPPQAFSIRNLGANGGEAPKVFDIKNLRGGLGLGRGFLRGRGGFDRGGLGRSALSGAMLREDSAPPGSGEPGALTSSSLPPPPGGLSRAGGGYAPSRGGGYLPSGSGYPPFGGGGFPPPRRGGFMTRGGRGRGRSRGRFGPRAGSDSSGFRPRQRRRSDEDDEGEEGDGSLAGVRKSMNKFMEPQNQEEHEYMERRDRGLPEPYNPSLRLEELLVHAPPVATDSSPYGKFATIIKNLRFIGGSRPYDIEGNFAPQELSKLVRRENMIFLTDPAKREELHEYIDSRRNKGAASKGQDRANTSDFELKSAGEAVREAISKHAIRGEYEAPQWADVTDPAKVARALHLKSETYLPPDLDRFQKKLNELLAKAGARRPPPRRATA